MGNDLKTSISKDDFMGRPQEEQSFLIYGAVQGIDSRVTKLEKRSWTRHPLALIGGIVGGIVSRLAG